MNMEMINRYIDNKFNGRANLILLFSFITFASFSVPAYSQENHLRKEIDKIIRFDADFDAENHPGYLIGIVDNDTTFLLSYPDSAILSSDIFEIGGLTKPFAAFYTIYLANQHKIDLTLPINSFLPEKFRNPELSFFILSDLLTHQIPFPRRPDNLSKKEYNLSDPYAHYSKMDLLEFYQSFVPPKKKRWHRQQLHYSHINYALLEIIMEIHLETAFQESFDAFLKLSLGLEATALSINPDAITEGYNLANQKIPPQTYYSFAASEGLKSNMKDLLKFMSINLFPEKSPMNITIKDVQKIQRKSSVSNHLLHSSGWYILKYPKSPYIYTHSGTTEGHKASMHFCPETATGVIILSKSTTGTGELGLLILRMINYNWTRKTK